MEVSFNGEKKTRSWCPIYSRLASALQSASLTTGSHQRAVHFSLQLKENGDNKGPVADMKLYPTNSGIYADFDQKTSKVQMLILTKTI